MTTEFCILSINISKKEGSAQKASRERNAR